MHEEITRVIVAYTPLIHYVKVPSFLFISIDRLHAKIHLFCNLCMSFAFKETFNKDRSIVFGKFV